MLVANAVAHLSHNFHGWQKQGKAEQRPGSNYQKGLQTGGKQMKRYSNEARTVSMAFWGPS